MVDFQVHNMEKAQTRKRGRDVRRSLHCSWAAQASGPDALRLTVRDSMGPGCRVGWMDGWMDKWIQHVGVESSS